MGLLAPVNLLYTTSLGVLLLIYLRASSRPTLEVPSLMLFEELPAPKAKSRFLRLDLLFWLEAMSLVAMTAAIAGLYVMSTRPASAFGHHALVFNLGAGMAAMDDGRSRLEEAVRVANRSLNVAPAGDEFSIITYALEARTPLPMTGRIADVRAALNALRALDVAPRPAAARAALIRARDADTVDLYSDRPLGAGVLDSAALPVAVTFNKVGRPAANLAIVALDPGVPRVSRGHCLIHNFSLHSQTFELQIDVGAHQVFHSTLVADSNSELMVLFGPLPAGGMVDARILTPDALAADNERFALAPVTTPTRALVLSPEPSVRDDLARLVLAINPNFIITAGDPNRGDSFDSKQNYTLALLHDCSVGRVDASAQLYIFPEPPFPGSTERSPAQVIGSVADVEMKQREGAGALGTPLLLGPARVIKLPGWMTIIAEGARVGGHAQIPLAAIGQRENGAVGVIAFDIRNHLLLDPDRMDALLLTIDMLRRLVTPSHQRVAATATDLEFVTSGKAIRVFGPDDTVQSLAADQWGRVRFCPLLAGRYRLVGRDGEIELMANYFNASESDLTSAVPRAANPAPWRVAVKKRSFEVQLLQLPLIALAFAALITESLLLAWRAHNPRMTNV